MMIVFTVNETAFGWEEIVAAAEVWGEWQRFTERTRQVLACLRMAAETGHLSSAKDVREAATAFRYAHNLISAEDTQVWLKRWEMTIDDLMTYLRGQLLAERWANRLETIAAEYPVSDEAVAKVIKHHAVCADLFGQWAQELAGRSAIAAASGSFDSAAGSPRELVARIESEFEQARQLAVTPQLLQTKISDHRLDWIRFDCRCLWFGDERQAREAVWCVTEDGLSLDEVAADARGEVRQWSFYLDEIDADVRPHFLAARQGDLLGPLKLRDGFPLVALTEKKLPASDDPQIRQRAENAAIAAWMGQAINERVKWMV
ncbi:MAG: hypothetical protein SF097_21220 [Acidobacteriota bacterium]|nr:hypothetical protein [Acidobacteriota bacterium]